jgi:transcriptional regulator with XRE-family HTH domain
MSLTSIDIGLRDLLKDPARRQAFFRSITQDEIAAQIRALRKKRNLTQTAFARVSDMKQSAVSRVEQAEYSSWTLATLFKVAAGLNARWRMILEPAEDAIAEFEQAENPKQSELVDIKTSKLPASAAIAVQPAPIPPSGSIFDATIGGSILVHPPVASHGGELPLVSSSWRTVS